MSKGLKSIKDMTESELLSYIRNTHGDLDTFEERHACAICCNGITSEEISPNPDIKFSYIYPECETPCECDDCKEWRENDTRRKQKDKPGY